MATQSSISVSGSSEQKVPSVRKGGRGGGGNRNSGGGPGHSGHSVLSSVSSSSILHLSVLKTTRKINARLILLTELLIGTRVKGREREALSLPLTHHLVIYSPFSFLPSSNAREKLASNSRGGSPISFFRCSPSLLPLETELLPFQSLRKTPQNARHGKTIYAGNLVTWAVEPRSYASLEQFFHGRGSKREEEPRKGKEREDKLVSKTRIPSRENRQRTNYEELKKEEKKDTRLTEKVGGHGLN